MEQRLTLSWPAAAGFGRIFALRRASLLTWNSALALLLAAVAALHVPTLSAYFHGDDFVALQDPSSKPILTHIINVFTFKDANFYWRPLGELYYLLLYKLFGLQPMVFHLCSLLMFLGTIWLLYKLCLRWGLPYPVALGAAAILGLFPNHVVSVAWITDAPRLQAMLFFLACLLYIEKAARSRKPSDEAIAWLFFILAGLSDETALSLAPVPVLLHLLRRPRPWGMRFLLTRTSAYALPVLAFTPLQFMFTIDDEPRLGDYRLGPHIFDQTWALAAQLALPIHSQSPLAESFASFDAVQWAAGGVVIAAALLLLLLGSWPMRLLVVWAGLGLAPFTLWDLDWTAPRYVYMTAIPFAVAVAWLAWAAYESLPRRVNWRGHILAAAAALLLVATVLSAGATLHRNDAWKQSSEQFRVLATGLKQSLPTVPKNSRVVIYYGVWEDFTVWPKAVVRTIYRDDTLQVVNVRKERADIDASARQPQDVVVFYAGGKFIPVPPAMGTRTATR